MVDEECFFEKEIPLCSRRIEKILDGEENMNYFCSEGEKECFFYLEGPATKSILNMISEKNKKW